MANSKRVPLEFDLVNKKTNPELDKLERELDKGVPKRTAVNNSTPDKNKRPAKR